jgi:hypothetical protein
MRAMGMFYKHWRKRSDKRPANTSELQEAIFQNRKFEPVDKLEYGDHGLHAAAELILDAIKKGKKIALYADYDVDELCQLAVVFKSDWSRQSIASYPLPFF